MIDVFFIATAASFFTLASAYVHFCERLRGDNRD